MKVSIKDISERTGFSPATVSNALNHKKGVNADTAAEIFRVAKEMGYISESRIGKIKFVIFKRNGLIIDDTPFFFTSDRRNRERVPGIGDGDGAVPPEL